MIARGTQNGSGAMSHPALTIAAAVALLAALPGTAQAEVDDLVRQGAWEYRDSCAVCHGEDGRGNTAMADLLTVAPTDLTRLAERSDGRFPIGRVIRVIDGRDEVPGHGSADMPVWGRTFRSEALAEGAGGPFGPSPETVVAGRVLALAEYLRAIQGGREVPVEPPERPLREWPKDRPFWPRID
jgi:mono/diheme cytochrome c family protein